jgi:hypothetical protein
MVSFAKLRFNFNSNYKLNTNEFLGNFYIHHVHRFNCQCLSSLTLENIYDVCGKKIVSSIANAKCCYKDGLAIAFIL